MEVDENGFIERDYQTVLAEQAFKSNKILFLPTGSGKTFIAIMVLKRLFHLLEPEFENGGKRAVFLVNTVALVEQQAQVLQRHLLLNGVGMYSGDMNVDFWDMNTWREEFTKFQVMVMTAEILNQLLLKKYISLSNLALVILDECHHAVEDHPMRQIMRLFGDCPEELQPRVIGLTATLLNGTPKSLPRVRDDVKTLEVTLHSTVATVNSWELVKQFSTNPIEKFVLFQGESNNALLNLISRKIDPLHALCKDFPFVKERTDQVRVIHGFIPLRGSKKNDVGNLMLQVTKQFGWLGMYGCAKTLVAIHITLKLLQQKMCDKNSHLMIQSLICSLAFISRLLNVHMKDGYSESEKAYHYSSSKVKVLLSLLKSHNEKCNEKPEKEREPMQALVFVEEKMTAKILCSVLKNVARNSPQFGFIRAAFVVGGTANPFEETWEGAYNRSINNNIVQRFRQNEINVLVATDVLEEGIDIPACNIVVRFDLAKSFRSYVQSKGRARHSTSLFCLMADSHELSQYRTKIQYFQQIESALELLLVGHTDDRLSPSERELEDLYESEVEPYFTPVGSKVTMTSAISLVNGYCMHLAHDRFCKVSPTWHRKKNTSSPYVVAMQLPRLSPFQELVQGLPMANIKIAKRAAALEMCKRLHECGELDDYLMPNEKYLEESEVMDVLPLWDKEDKTQGSEAKTGTKNKVRQYTLLDPVCIQDCAPTPQTKMYLHNIEMYPDYEQPPLSDSRKYIMFSVLKEQRNFAIISSKPLPQICHFPVFSKFGALKVKVQKGVPIRLDEDKLMTLTLFHYHLFSSMIPMSKSHLSFSKRSYFVAASKCDANGVIALDWTAMNKCLSPCHTKVIPEKCVVSPIHRGSNLHEVFFVTRICPELSGLSPFPDENYKSYENYFLAKHNFPLSHPSMPLVELQPFKNVSNDLLPRKKSSQDDRSMISDMYLPLELCKVTCVEGCLYVKGTLLPSVLHRLKCFLKADELCRTIQTNIGGVPNQLNTPHDCSFKTAAEESRLTTQTSCIQQNAVVAFKEIAVSRNKSRQSSSQFSQFDNIVDLNHDFEMATDEDVKMYGMVVQKKVSSVNSPFRVTIKKRSLLQDDNSIPKLHLISNRKSSLHPCHILEATTAASADDIVNLERLETLGDAFLKFAVSFMLFNRFPKLSEGKLTQVKGQILGNRNLFYCADAKQLGNYLQVQKTVPSEHWLPPSFSIPEEIFTNNLLHVHRYLSLSGEEQFNNEVKTETLDDLQIRSLKMLTLSGGVQSSSCKGVTHQAIPDKTMADSVEALIGASLTTAGPKTAVLFLEYMRVLPPNTVALLESTQQSGAAGLQIGGRGFSLSFGSTITHVNDTFGYRFKNSSLLIEALTHASSPSATTTYERLEFVGDAVLDFLITAFIYENCGKLTPGELTDLRSALVNNITFACLSVRTGLYKLMEQGSIPLMDAMDRFVRFQEQRNHVIDEEILILLEEHECKIAETVDVPKALGDVFEALMGAVFLDSGMNFQTVWNVVYRIMKVEIKHFSEKVPKQVVRRLYEAVGEHRLSFRVSESTQELLMQQVHGVLSVQIGDEVRTFHGFGANKAAAKKSAAKLALRQLVIE